SVGENENAHSAALQLSRGGGGRPAVDRRVPRLLLCEVDGIQAGPIGLLQKEQIAAFVDDADRDLHVAFLHLGLGRGGQRFNGGEVEIFTGREVGGHRQQQGAEKHDREFYHGQHD